MAKRVLFGWELGEGNGHLRPYLSLLRELASRGWDVGVAQRNTAVAATELAATGWPVFQAPVCQNEFSGISASPANHTEICLAAGFAHAETLLGLVSAWRALFRSFEPDLVIGNFSPVLMLASHAAGVPALRLGTGYNSPPLAGRPPLIQPWTPGLDERLDRAEAHALKTANGVMRALGLPPLAELGAALEGRGTLLATIPAIDPFSSRPASHEYIGPLPASRLPAVDGALPEVFASLRMDHPHAEAALQALRGCGRRAWAYVPDATPAWCARISTPDLLVSPQPFDLPTALGACRAVVTYGGHSLVLAALLAGRPLLLLPGSGEQRLTAMKVTELGAGLAAGRDERPARVATALKRILEEAAFTEAARRIEAGQPPDVGSRALARAVAACEAAVMPSPVPLKVVRS